MLSKLTTSLMYISNTFNYDKKTDSNGSLLENISGKFSNNEENMEEMTYFLDWISQHEKQYSSQTDFQKRFKIFSHNLELVQKYNEREFEEDESDDEDKHLLELNKFADLTQAEYQKMLGFRPNLSEVPQDVESLNGMFSDLPDSIDWAAKGVVTPIKNQGSCGSCWAFSATGSIESAYWIKNGSQVLLSEQQLIDCSISYGNNGCGGGLVEYGYNYAKHVPLETEGQYPYLAKDTKCSQKEQAGDVELTDFKEVKRHDPVELATALVQGPVSIGVDASSLGMKLYKKGIIKRFCDTTIDHAVLLVGYGNDHGTDFWLVKNSWGADWGENGYFRVLRDMSKNDEGMCGILQVPTYPII